MVLSDMEGVLFEWYGLWLIVGRSVLLGISELSVIGKVAVSGCLASRLLTETPAILQRHSQHPTPLKLSFMHGLSPRPNPRSLDVTWDLLALYSIQPAREESFEHIRQARSEHEPWLPCLNLSEEG